MAKHKSISQRLRYNIPAVLRQEIVNDWTKAKQDEFFEVYRQLEQAIGRDDRQEIFIALDSLKNIGIKVFDAVPNIAKSLLAPPRNAKPFSVLQDKLNAKLTPEQREQANQRFLAEKQKLLDGYYDNN